MYHLRDVTLSFTMPKWHTYECPFAKAPSLSREGWGGSLPLPREGWGGVVFKPFTATPYYNASYIFSWSVLFFWNTLKTLHLYILLSWYRSISFTSWNQKPVPLILLIIRCRGTLSCWEEEERNWNRNFYSIFYPRKFVFKKIYVYLQPNRGEIRFQWCISLLIRTWLKRRRKSVLE